MQVLQIDMLKGESLAPHCLQLVDILSVAERCQFKSPDLCSIVLDVWAFLVIQYV